VSEPGEFIGGGGSQPKAGGQDHDTPFSIRALHLNVLSV
jgi:hypothetical protein